MCLSYVIKKYGENPLSVEDMAFTDEVNTGFVVVAPSGFFLKSSYRALMNFRDPLTGKMVYHAKGIESTSLGTRPITMTSYYGKALGHNQYDNGFHIFTTLDGALAWGQDYGYLHGVHYLEDMDHYSWRSSDHYRVRIVQVEWRGLLATGTQSVYSQYTCVNSGPQHYPVVVVKHRTIIKDVERADKGPNVGDGINWVWS